jgi:hypothetical protein
VECAADYDCAQAPLCPPDSRASPSIDYLAKDYQGFRRLMLDRLSLTVPGWTERSAADLGVALVELIAYAADTLSYRQDAIGNEAYLATARQRISVRRHARLVDYFLHEGCNARAFVHFDVAEEALALPAGTRLLTRVPGLPAGFAEGSAEEREALAAGALTFQTGHDVLLDARLNRLGFYTWGDEGCCLPRGTIAATLQGALSDILKVGDIIVFQEVASPTAATSDADPTHRWAVRLTSVAPGVDPSGGLFAEPPVNGPIDVTEIGWDAADALPFPLCLSVADRPGLEISVALGNIALVDQGETIADEGLGAVPQPTLALAPAAPSGCCDDLPETIVPPRYRPALAAAPLTHGFDLATLIAVPVVPGGAWWPASSLLAIDPRAATPRIALTSTLGTISEGWVVRRDLLSSGDDATDYVVEIEGSGRALLRFGDDDHGKRPDPDTSFVATYRRGNGAAGNVGADAIAHIVSPLAGAVTAVANPMPAGGGVEPEDIEAVRRDAPEAFRTQERAVTPADYAAAAERRPDVQKAAATFRWTGSWHTVFVTPDRYGGRAIDATFKAALRRHLERFRIAGYDLDINAPQFVPLDVALHVCVKPDYFRADVVRAVAARLSSGVQADGTPGLFAPDNFTFAQPVYLSAIIAAAQAVEGVDSVRVDRFQRLIGADPVSLADGVIGIGGLEIAELAGNPNFPERGRLALVGGGGK